MTIRQILNRLIDEVPENSNRRFNCPKCNGNNSLSITKSGSQVHYNCFENVCKPKLRGSLHQLVSLDSLKTRLKASNRAKSEFQVPFSWIKGVSSKNIFNLLLTTNSTVAYEAGLFKVAFDPEQNRMCYLIEDKGKIVGAVGRSLGNTIPKVLIYKDSATVPFICGNGDILVLVEDCASACAVTRKAKFTGMALLGTNLKEEYIPYIHKYSSVIVALDRDAKTTAIKIRNSLQYYHKDVSMWLLEKDIKDMNAEELSESCLKAGL